MALFDRISGKKPVPIVPDDLVGEAREGYEKALRKMEEWKVGRRLDLSRLELTAAPPELGQLSALKRLYLQRNRLTALPPELGQLTLLTALWLHHNQLTALPTELGELSALTELNLTDNQLMALPTELKNLTALEYLFLHGNPALHIPNSVLGPTINETFHDDSDRKRVMQARPADILNFYFARQEAAAGGTLRRLNEIKVMLVGDGGAGKTSLRRFLVGEEHVPDEPETLGIALDTLFLSCGREEFTLRLWDFAGQEITHALHQFFLTEGCVYIVVVEPRSDSEQSDAEKWLKLIGRHGKGSPVLVVLNKQDTRLPRGYDLERNWLQERYPFIRGFLPTSCGLIRTGCDAFLAKLYEVVNAMPPARLEVPGSWLEVKDACFAARQGQAKRYYLSLTEFRELCAQHGEQDGARQESLARILHNLGAVLHFVDEPRLRDTAVLDPHWVTDGAYRLLRCKDGPQSDGTLTLAEAVAAMPGADAKGTRYLLRLMERFEMCFTLEDPEGGFAELWLVPGALDKNQPDTLRLEEWRATDAVRLRFQYDPLPQGVLPRLIVMTHLLSEGAPRWRHGVILHDGAARALIRKGQKDHTVEVTVQGPKDDREKLVKAVRGYLARIHADLPEPKPKEYQALAGTEEYRELEQLRDAERADVPIVTKTAAGVETKSATEELNRSSAQPPRTGKKRPLRVFLSYAHEDKKAQGLFRKNLMALESDGYITFWDDPNLKAGMEWRAEIDRELETMDVFVGLLTTNFHTSNFIQRVEFEAALPRRTTKTELWLVLVDDRRIAGTPYAKFQVMKPDGKAVNLHHRGMKGGFDAVEKEMCALVERLWAAQPDREEGRRGMGEP
jgi:internalin A